MNKIDGIIDAAQKDPLNKIFKERGAMACVVVSDGNIGRITIQTGNMTYYFEVVALTEKYESAGGNKCKSYQFKYGGWNFHFMNPVEME